MASRRARTWTAIAVAGLIFLFMALAIRQAEGWGNETEPMDSDTQLDQVADGLFTDHVVAFEVLGVLLTAAMIGALVIARPLGAAHDASNYPVVPKDVAQQALDVSDPKKRNATGATQEERL